LQHYGDFISVDQRGLEKAAESNGEEWKLGCGVVVVFVRIVTGKVNWWGLDKIVKGKELGKTGV